MPLSVRHRRSNAGRLRKENQQLKQQKEQLIAWLFRLAEQYDQAAPPSPDNYEISYCLPTPRQNTTSLLEQQQPQKAAATGLRACVSKLQQVLQRQQVHLIQLEETGLAMSSQLLDLHLQNVQLTADKQKLHDRCQALQVALQDEEEIRWEDTHDLQTFQHACLGWCMAQALASSLSQNAQQPSATMAAKNVDLPSTPLKVEVPEPPTPATYLYHEKQKLALISPDTAKLVPAYKPITPPRISSLLQRRYQRTPTGISLPTLPMRLSANTIGQYTGNSSSGNSSSGNSLCEPMLQSLSCQSSIATSVAEEESISDTSSDSSDDDSVMPLPKMLMHPSSPLPPTFGKHTRASLLRMWSTLHAINNHSHEPCRATWRP